MASSGGAAVHPGNPLLNLCNMLLRPSDAWRHTCDALRVCNACVSVWFRVSYILRAFAHQPRLVFRTNIITSLLQSARPGLDLRLIVATCWCVACNSVLIANNFATVPLSVSCARVVFALRSQEMFLLFAVHLSGPKCICE